MTALARILAFLLRASPWAMARGAALAIAVLIMGAALLGLSGWFITAAGLAGLAGIGIGFDFFRPSAGVRFLALGRAAARYGERLLTHDATLKALASLRVRLLEQEATQDARGLMQFRSEAVLTRIVADVDALDGLALRLLLPVIAGLLTHAMAFLILGWLVGWPMALAILVGIVPFSALILWWLGLKGRRPSATAESKSQALRRGLIDMIRDRAALIVRGQIRAREDALVMIDQDAREAAGALDKAERDTGFLLSAILTLAAAAALGIAGWMVASTGASPAIAAIGVFVALALAETVLPLRRGFAELGRMAGAAERIGTLTPLPKNQAVRERAKASTADFSPVLSVKGPCLDLDLKAGDALALTGPSGVGKTTLLLEIAGLGALRPHKKAPHIAVFGRPPEEWDETDFRSLVTMVPQRSALLRGTIRENLSLACDAAENQMWTVLAAVDLVPLVQERGGLDMALGEGGSNLSGGQAKRLCIARALLKRPALLLLDEPTEGLDDETSHNVLFGIRQALPEAAIIAAIHRGFGHSIFGQRRALVLPTEG